MAMQIKRISCSGWLIRKAYLYQEKALKTLDTRRSLGKSSGIDRYTRFLFSVSDLGKVPQTPRDDARLDDTNIWGLDVIHLSSLVV